jgi:AcrR family transcriptional regulator
MEAATTQTQTQTQSISGEKAQRIVDAMRASVARRGAAGSTFDHVAREAGVSRGLLHYYFGTKERLLVEVVRRDAEIRLAALGASLGDARTGDDFIDALVRSLEELIERDPGFVVLFYELFTLSRRNEEIAGELTALCRQTRETLAASLAAKQEEGVVRLGDDAEAVAGVLLALADGLALRFLTEGGVDPRPTLKAAVAAARALIADAR